MSSPIVSTAPELRAWAKGRYDLEAAAELLIRAHGGRFAGADHPWIGTDGESVWIDADLIVEDTIGVYSSGEQRVLLFVAALLQARTIALSDLASVDRGMLALLLAALAHAGASHAHGSGDTVMVGAGGAAYLQRGPGASLYPWPAEDAEAGL